jgi:pyruvate formate lyase activating enzyme
MSIERPLVFRGIQKTTLVDYPGEVACTLFTGGCNFKCGYCYNPSLALDEDTGVAISVEEALEFLALRKNFLDGVCITGGEPLIEPGLADFIGQVKALGYKIKLDTNGSFPERLKPLLDQKLVDYVALDIKTSRKKYHEITGLAGSHEKVEASVRLLLSSGVECEFRTTVFSHLDENDFHEIASWLGKGQNYYLQKGRGNLLHLSEEFIKKHNEVGAEQLERMAGVLRPHFNKVGIR